MRTSTFISSFALALLMLAPSAGATDFYVTTTADSADGICDAHCSLREAVIAANGNGVADVIHLGAGTYELSIPGADEVWSQTGDLDLRTSMEIIGMGPNRTIIDANGIDRVMDIKMGGIQVAIRGVTLTGGWLGSAGGGAAFDIYSSGCTITIQTCIIEGNYSTAAESTAGGGIAFNGGSTTASTLNVIHSMIRNNSARKGGGLHIFGTASTVNIDRSSIYGNTTFDGTGTIDITHATVTIDTSTVSNNTATTGDAGIRNTYGNVTITGCTLAENTGSEVVAWSGSGGVVTLERSVIDGACTVYDPVFIASNGFNLESPGDTCELGTWDKTNIPDTKLDPLNWNGGPTLTMHPQPLSPVVDPIFALFSPSCPGRDQRGMTRPHDGESDADSDAECDLGAVERRPGSIFNDDFECGFTASWSAITP